jgi:GAF domain-containing protein
VEPIPETAQAITDFGPFVIEDDDLLTELQEKSRQVQGLVPQCLGLSLASNQDGLTFTLVATANEIAVLDAIQYVAGGPCVGAVKAERVVAYEQTELFDEQGWQLFAHATAAATVASTLTLPILGGGRVIGSVNLYAATPTAFDGHHEAIARIFDAWAPGAVTNADLSFTTRGVAETAPDCLREDIDLTVASGLIAHQDHVSVEDGRRRLREAARRAGVSEVQLAQTIIELRRPQGTG